MADNNSIKLSRPQTRFFLADHKFVLFCGGFGSGKSEALFLKMLKTKIDHPKVPVGYFAPSYQLIRDIAHGRVCEMLDRMGMTYNLNKSENNLYIDGYGLIMFRTMDVPDKIIGYELFAAFIDELDTMRIDAAENAWNKIMARNRKRDPDDPMATNNIYVATTPEGFRFCYDRWVKNPTHHYVMIKAPTYTNPYLTDDYIEALRTSYPANLVEAYIEGEFVNLNSKVVYSNFNRKTHHADRSDTWDTGDVHIGIDFNILNCNATVHTIDGNKVHAVGEIIRKKDTPDLIRAIEFMFSEADNIYVYPDASGKSRKTLDASTSDITLLKDAGFIVKAKSKNPFIKNRIQSMQAKFQNGHGEITYTVDTTHCPNYTDALEKQSFDQNGVPEKDYTNSIDDINDSAGYFIHYKFPITKRKFTSSTVAYM